MPSRRISTATPLPFIQQICRMIRRSAIEAAISPERLLQAQAQLRAISSHVPGPPTCMYEFAWRSPQLGGRLGRPTGRRYLSSSIRFALHNEQHGLLLLVVSVVPAGWVGVAFLFYKNCPACEAARRGSLIANTGVGRRGTGRDKLFNGPSESEHKEETQ
jgi:hypothetical protein